ncbi:MAG TPA: redox-sensing transcriptional repressor Rex [Magnetospirillaceae bacterium]|nr:redox-sensing transcriptional repressor Rex [Magnetospirillaceae bacterium]
MVAPIGVPLPTLRRLPLYYRIFQERQAAGHAWLSSESLGRLLGFGAIQIRKDLGAIGATGSPKLGYPVAATAESLKNFLGVDNCKDVFLVGSGILGRAVLADKSIASHGYRIVGVFDPAPDGAERMPDGREILPMDKLPDLVRRMGVRLAVLTVDAGQAGDAAAILVRAGVEAVLDLTGASASFPVGILVARHDLGSHLATLGGELTARKR